MNLALTVDDIATVPMTADPTGWTARFARDDEHYTVHVTVTRSGPQRATPAKARFTT